MLSYLIFVGGLPYNFHSAFDIFNEFFGGKDPFADLFGGFEDFEDFEEFGGSRGISL